MIATYLQPQKIKTMFCENCGSLLLFTRYKLCKNCRVEFMADIQKNYSEIPEWVDSFLLSDDPSDLPPFDDFGNLIDDDKNSD